MKNSKRYCLNIIYDITLKSTIEIQTTHFPMNPVCRKLPGVFETLQTVFLKVIFKERYLLIHEVILI